MVSGGATSSTIRTLVTAAVKFPKSETKVRSILRIITSAVTRHEKDSLVADFGRHKLHEGQKMICCRSLGTSAAMTAEEHTSRQYFAVVYDYVPDILERRGQYRAEHLALANQLVDEGKVLLGGAWGSPVDGALLIFYVHNIKGTFFQVHIYNNPILQGICSVGHFITPDFSNTMRNRLHPSCILIHW